MLKALLVIALFVSGCSDRWEGFVYPNKNNLSTFVNIGSFETLESCRAKSIARLDALSKRLTGDYECGKNCDSGAKLGGLKICEETVR